MFFFFYLVPSSQSITQGLNLNSAALPHLLSNSSTNQQLLNALQPQQLLHAAQAVQAQVVQASQVSQQPLLAVSPQQQQHNHRHTTHLNHYQV